jgi:hypothetical protein
LPGRLRQRLLAAAILFVATVSVSLASAQVGSAVSATVRATNAAGREFAPGVLTTIEPDVDRSAAILVHDLVEIRSDEKLTWKPASFPQSRTLHEMAAAAPFVQDVWCLEFTFKPLRMIEVDVPQPGGQTQRQLVWYMVYRVRNTGAAEHGEVHPDGTFSTTPAPVDSLRFMPHLVLTSHDLDDQGEPVRKSYLDRVLPAAIEPIGKREFGAGELLHSVQMAQQTLPLETGRSQQGRWGVATWVGIDPDVDFFSVSVRGLTNAYQWEDPAGAYQAGDPPGKGRTFTWRVLQLNFWRPGDRFGENEREIRYGAAPDKGAYYEGGEGVAYRWVYR